MSIEIIGHGGAGDFYPGNSRDSIEKALELGVDRIEIDVLATGDNDLVLVHDDKIAIERGKRAPVRALPTNVLRARLDSMLTLDEFFELVGPTMPVLLDLKKPGYERAVALALSGQEQRDIWISTTHARSIRKLRILLPWVQFGLSSGHMANAVNWPMVRPFALVGARLLMPLPYVAVAKFCGASMLMVNHRACTPFLVRLAHRAGLRVDAWTVNRISGLERVKAMGVDAITSNRPDLARQVVDR
jgi:glycerophosphoryl diester phosphodiesterase